MMIIPNMTFEMIKKTFFCLKNGWFYKILFRGENFFEKKFSPHPFQKTLNWIE